MTINNNIQKFTVTLPETFNNILKKIDINSYGIIFAVNRNLKILGSITDGDIRRALIKNTIRKKINFRSSIINKNFFSLPSHLKSIQIIPYLGKEIKNKRINCIPLVNKKGIIKDVSTLSSLRRFPLVSVKIGEEELKNLTNCIRTGWISSLGGYVSEFEEKFRKYINAKYATSTTSGTSALELGMKSLGLKSGDEVIVPNLTFAASINAIINIGCKPIIADIEKSTWTIDINKVGNLITKNTKAIMAVHIYGQPCRLDELKIICKRKRLFLIEDAAEALGAFYKKKLIGTHGDCICFSFFANKLITTGEGGMVVFNKKKYLEKAVILKSHGMTSSKFYNHKLVGSNYRMTNIQAAIGCAQLTKIKQFIKERKDIFEYYDKSFSCNSHLMLLPKNNWSTNSYWLYTISLKNFGKNIRDKIINFMLDKGIECRPGFPALSSFSIFKKFSKDLYPVSEELSNNLISFPSNNLSKIEQDFIIKNFFQIISILKK